MNEVTTIPRQDLAQVRAQKEIESAIISAKKFPRDVNLSYTKIMQACERKSLAEKAIYKVPRSGKAVTGPTIRIGETMAVLWGNLDYGIREISRGEGETMAEAYCIDLETNTRAVKQFIVPHIRYTNKDGNIPVTSPKDISDIVYAQGSKMLRDCIFRIIPPDVTEDAIAKCLDTIRSSGSGPIGDRVRKMAKAFFDIGINKTHLEIKLGHSLDNVNEEELGDMIIVYNSIKEGQAKREDFFDFREGTVGQKSEELISKLEGGNK